MKHSVGRSANSLEDDYRDEDDGGETGRPGDRENLVGVGLRDPKQYTLTIEYKDVNLKLRATGKTIVSGATGKVAPGRVTAIMGPSGSGKTSLLAAISGKNASRYEMSGSLTVNGVPRGLGKYGTDCAFVPQDDIVHPDLRVREVRILPSPPSLVSPSPRLPVPWTPVSQFPGPRSFQRARADHGATSLIPSAARSAPPPAPSLLLLSSITTFAHRCLSIL